MNSLTRSLSSVSSTSVLAERRVLCFSPPQAPSTSVARYIESTCSIAAQFAADKPESYELRQEASVARSGYRFSITHPGRPLSREAWMSLFTVLSACV